MSGVALRAANAALVLIAPFLLVGIVTRVKAWWSGRRGAPVLQALWDFIKLLGKGQVTSSAVSALFPIAPSISLAATVGAALLVPQLGHASVVSFSGDFVVFAYLLGVARFMSIVAAMDTGSSFEGMGASREAFFSTLLEPGFFVVAGTLAIATGASTFSDLLGGASGSTAGSVLFTVLAAAAFFIMLLVEGSRLPVDDPATHLELTMVHEVMVLDNSGPDLAFIQYAALLRLYLFAAIVADVVIPARLSVALAAAAFTAALFVIGVLVGLIESWSARLRLTHVPQFIFLVNVCGIVLFFLAVVGIRR